MASVGWSLITTRHRPHVACHTRCHIPIRVGPTGGVRPVTPGGQSPVVARIPSGVEQPVFSPTGLGDRRSGVQISPARQINTLFEQAFHRRWGF